VPPAKAALVPLSKSSTAGDPKNGNYICVWVSIPPGMMNFPLASIIFAFDGASISPTY